MTIRRIDSHSTEFGLWLREQEELDSTKGYRATNIDYLWKSNKTGEYMLVEEKRHGSCVKDWQAQIFKQLDSALKTDKNYKGFHTLIFENTSPEDGYVLLDGKKITRQQVIKFLQFHPLS